LNIVWLTWKDRLHPAAGGAETVSGEIMDRLVRDGHSVQVITSKYEGSTDSDIVNGIKFDRVGNRYSVYLAARKLFKSKYNSGVDLVIDEMNTLPFGAPFYTKTKSVLLNYQLARSVWFYQMSFPFSLVGYLTEPPMLRLLSKKYSAVATESQSAKNDLLKYGFQNVQIFKVGISLKPLETLEEKVHSSTILSLGAMRPMKRTLHAVKSFELAKDKNPALKMVIAGDDKGRYAESVKKYIQQSRHTASIAVLGRVTPDERVKLMEQAMIILVTSVKEGWGLIVTEAASQGTVAIVYDTDGLRDSVQHKVTGIVTKNNDVRKMSEQILDIINDTDTYDKMRTSAWTWSKQFTFENSYQDFLKIIT